MTKTMLYQLLLFISLFLGACEKSDPITPDNQEMEQDTIFELVWANRMNFDKEIVNLSNGVSFKDWFIYPGDLDDPSTIMAFNKDTGEKDWELILDEVPGSEIVFMVVHDNLLIAKNAYSLFAIDLETRNLLWYKNLHAIGIRLGRMTLAENNKVYLKADFGFGTSLQILHIFEFDPLTGENRVVYSKSPDNTGIYSCSPPAIWNDPESGKELLIFNLYPDSYAPPEKGAQFLIGVDPSTKEELWSIPIVDQFGSGGGHAPVIVNNIAITGGWDKIFSIDLISKKISWETKFDYPWAVWSKTQRLVVNDKIYANTSQEDVACLDLETGNFIWTNPKGGPNCTDNMLYYEKEDLLVFTSWGYGSVMILDAITGETIHREHRYDNSSFNNDIVYDEERDMFFTSTHKHAIGFKVRRPR
jgi:outer membrane protein assembly factor BamB